MTPAEIAHLDSLIQNFTSDTPFQYDNANQEVWVIRKEGSPENIYIESRNFWLSPQKATAVLRRFRDTIAYGQWTGYKQPRRARIFGQDHPTSNSEEAIRYVQMKFTAHKVLLSTIVQPIGELS